MTYHTAQACEAYVIEADGTRRSIPINFGQSAHQGFYPGSSAQSGTHPFATFLHQSSNGQTQRKTGLGTRILGAALVMVGVPMLILPGPGIAAIIVGLALLFRR